MTTKRQTNCNEPATSRSTFFPLKPALAGGFQAAPRQCALSGAEPANWRGDKFFRRRTAHWGWVAGLHSTGVITAPVGFTRLSPPPEFSSPTKINFTICPDDRDERESDAASVGASACFGLDGGRHWHEKLLLRVRRLFRPDAFSDPTKGGESIRTIRIETYQNDKIAQSKFGRWLVPGHGLNISIFHASRRA